MEEKIIGYDGMMTKTIFVLGAPASGKSTFIRLFGKMAGENGQSWRWINDGEVLRNQCPLGRSEKYYYDEGALILVDDYREELLGNMWRGTAEEANRVQGSVDYCLVEFTSPDWMGIMSDFFGNFWDKGADLVFLRPGMDISTKRNAEREGASRIPEAYLAMFPDEVDIQELGQGFDRVEVIGNEKGRDELASDVARYFRSLKG